MTCVNCSGQLPDGTIWCPLCKKAAKIKQVLRDEEQGSKVDLPLLLLTAAFIGAAIYFYQHAQFRPLMPSTAGGVEASTRPVRGLLDGVSDAKVAAELANGRTNQLKQELQEMGELSPNPPKEEEPAASKPAPAGLFGKVQGLRRKTQKQVNDSADELKVIEKAEK